MKSKIIIALIILLAALLRLYNLGETPRGLYLDEPSLGYNAYSILKTVKDEHGVFLPLAFRAYGEYKLPGYIYASTPFIAVFGLNAFSIRLLSALSGIAGAFAMYLITKELLAKSHPAAAQKIALLAATLWAISPWNIQLSRAAFEANFMLTLTIFGFFFVLIYLVTYRKLHIMSAVLLLTAAFYTYNAARLFIPLFLTIILVLNIKRLPRIKTTIAIVSLLLLMLPGFIGSTGSQGGQRIREVFELENKEFMLGPILGVTQKYLTHFAPQYLFLKGDTNTARHGNRELGNFYLYELITISLGVVIFAKSSNPHKKFLFLWLLLAPLPAALATPVPHALRSVLMLPPLIIFSALGCYALILQIKKHLPHKFLHYPAFTVVILVVSYAFFTYLHVYYQHYKFRTSWDWNEHTTRLAEYLATTYPQDNHRFFIEAGSQDSVYIKFFNASHNRATDIDKYTFFDKDRPLTLQNGDIVAISGWKGTPSEMKDVKEIKLLNESIGYKVGRWEK